MLCCEISFCTGTNHLHSKGLQHRSNSIFKDNCNNNPQRQVLTVQGQSKLAFDSRSSCLCLPSTKVSDMHYLASTWLSVHWSISRTPSFYGGQEGRHPYYFLHLLHIAFLLTERNPVFTSEV